MHSLHAYVKQPRESTFSEFSPRGLTLAMPSRTTTLEARCGTSKRTNHTNLTCSPRAQVPEKASFHTRPANSTRPFDLSSPSGQVGI